MSRSSKAGLAATGPHGSTIHGLAPTEIAVAALFWAGRVVVEIDGATQIDPADERAFVFVSECRDLVRATDAARNGL